MPRPRPRRALCAGAAPPLPTRRRRSARRLIPRGEVRVPPRVVFGLRFVDQVGRGPSEVDGRIRADEGEPLVERDLTRDIALDQVDQVLAHRNTARLGLAPELIAQLHRHAADLEVGGLPLHPPRLACRLHAGDYFVGKMTFWPTTGSFSPIARSSGAILLARSAGRTEAS